MTRLALIGIIIDDMTKVAEVNELLHAVGEYVLGRMGLPCKDRGVHVISVIVDAPQNVISSVCGKLGSIGGVNVKAMYTQVGVE